MSLMVSCALAVTSQGLIQNASPSFQTELKSRRLSRQFLFHELLLESQIMRTWHCMSVVSIDRKDYRTYLKQRNK